MKQFHNIVTTVEFKDNVVNLLTEYVQNTYETPESGGVLMGKRLFDGSIIITDITKPQKSDRWGRSHFKKDGKIHQKISDKIWQNSGGYIMYLGEWHTHPELFPSPSFIDLKGWRLNVYKQKDKKKYIFLIVGTNSFKVWTYSRVHGLLKTNSK